MLMTILKNSKWFLIPYFIVLIAVFPGFIIYSKADLHLWLNGFHNQFFDVVFKYMTWLGDGIFISSIAIVVMFFSFRNAVFILSTYIATGAFAQLLKLVVFPGVDRPVTYFHGMSDLHFVEGVKLLSSRSFPSGHATTAFAFFLCLAILAKSKWIKLLCLVLACMAAYSRVYLSQHFLIDIYAGSVIGIAGAIGMYIVLYSSEKKWHHKNIISLIKSNA